MILHDERNRLGFAISGAVIIHTLIFVGVQLGIHLPQTPPEPAPIFVELNAPVEPAPPEPQPAQPSSAAEPSAAAQSSAPAQPSTPEPAAATAPSPGESARAPSAPAAPSPPKPSTSVAAKSAPTNEYDPLARAPTAADLNQPREPAPRRESPATAPGSTGSSTASQQDNSFQKEQNQALEQFRQNNPVRTGSVAQGSSSSGGAASAGPSSGGGSAGSGSSALDRRMNSTFDSIAQAQAGNGQSGSTAKGPPPSNQTAPDGAASSASSAAQSGAVQSAGGSRANIEGVSTNRFGNGQFALNDAIVRRILQEHPNHPPVIEVIADFTVLPSGFVTNLQLRKGSGYTRLDEEIRKLFQGEVFKPAPSSPPVQGRITYRIETDTAR